MGADDIAIGVPMKHYGHDVATVPDDRYLSE
jgi:hypothetical protein